MSTRSELITGFPHVPSDEPHSLILGSMPGVASLQAAEYYAHPRNAFWWLMEQLLGIAADLPYLSRLQQLGEAGYLLWDVVHRCERPGSLDSAIRGSTVAANDFAALLAQYPTVRHVYFNGGAAAKLWRQHVQPSLADNALQLTTLPSTSPAYAAMSRDQKRDAWQAILANR